MVYIQPQLDSSPLLSSCLGHYPVTTQVGLSLIVVFTVSLTLLCRGFSSVKIKNDYVTRALPSQDFHSLGSDPLFTVKSANDLQQDT